MSKKRTTSTAPVKHRASSKTQEDPHDAAESRKFMTIMIIATVALVFALYFLLR